MMFSIGTGCQLQSTLQFLKAAVAIPSRKRRLPSHSEYRSFKKNRMTAKDGDILFLSEDLVAEILSRLCVKSLVRFKLVSKSWYGMITSPYFVSQHLNINRDRSHLLIDYYYDSVKIVSDETLVSLSKQLFHVPVDQFVRLHGPCNGIFCIELKRTMPDNDLSPCQPNFALWNPATKEFRRLPHASVTMPDDDFSSMEPANRYGFGLDPITKDYKLVLIQEFMKIYTNDIRLYHAFVYSLATDSWEDLGKLQLLPPQFRIEDGSVYTYTNGMYYWLVHDPSQPLDVVIVSFDMSKHVFQRIKGPGCFKSFGGRLALYNDSFGLFSIDDWVLTLWVMDGGNWIKKISIDAKKASLLDYIPHGILKDGQVILEYKDNQLFLFDPLTRKCRDLGDEKTLISNEKMIFMYKESLVAITTTNRLPNQH